MHEALKVKNYFKEEEKLTLGCFLWPIMVILVLQKPKKLKFKSNNIFLKFVLSLTKMWARSFATKLSTFGSRIFTMAQTYRQTKKNPTEKLLYKRKKITKRIVKKSFVTNMNCDDNKKNTKKVWWHKYFWGNLFCLNLKNNINIFLDNFLVKI